MRAKGVAAVVGPPSTCTGWRLDSAIGSAIKRDPVQWTSNGSNLSRDALCGEKV